MDGCFRTYRRIQCLSGPSKRFSTDGSPSNNRGGKGSETLASGVNGGDDGALSARSGATTEANQSAPYSIRSCTSRRGSNSPPASFGNPCGQLRRTIEI